ncbi:hypothetical protein EV421DRAFT_1737825 [Armillaria borealis]|uniref:Uncharacterized protein n=1 Tax=Armillaria borealis TaxID=47425 RepID=A0AA39JCW9_9AGAR|nr:hypothetical protein EV421DRAFT_1737825 [Armillaria borealis]
MSTSISQDQSKTIFKTSDLVLNSTLLEAFLHGMYTIVFLSGIVKLSTKKGRNTLLTASVLVFLYSSKTVHLSVRWYWIRQAFMVNGVTEMATYQSLLSINYKWMWAVSGICIASCAILEIVFSGFFLYQDISHSSSNTTWGPDAVNWGTVYFTMSLITTVLSTCLIVFHIVKMGGGASSPVLLRSYQGIIEIVIESTALYMLTLIIFLAFFIHDDARSAYPQAILNIVMGVAPTLIVLRVTSGQARPNEYRDWA